MNESLTIFALSWAVLAGLIIALALYRKLVSAHEDDTLHLAGPSMAEQQFRLARRLDIIDRWGKILTVVALVYGIALASAYVYISWAERDRMLG